MASEAQNRANARYQAKAYEKVEIRVKKGTRERWKDAASTTGESLAGFISKAVENRIEKEKTH